MKKIGTLLVGVLLTLAMLPSLTVEATETLSKPQVALTEYYLEDETIVLGEDNSVHLEFTNFSGEYPVTDVLVSFASSNYTIVPVYGKTNQIYFPEIPAKGTVEADLPISIVNQENGYSGMSFMIQYCAGGVLLSNDTSYIVIPVDVEEKLSIENVSVSPSAQVNSKVSLLVSYKNISEIGLKDISLTIEGEDFATPIELPVKNLLAAGESGYFEYYLAFDSTGNKMLNLELKGFDEEGNEYVLDCGEYSVRVTDSETVDGENDIPEKNPDTPGNTEPGEDEKEALNIYIVIGVIAAIIIVCLLIGAVSSKKRAK